MILKSDLFDTAQSTVSYWLLHLSSLVVQQLYLHQDEEGVIEPENFMIQWSMQTFGLWVDETNTQPIASLLNLGDVLPGLLYIIENWRLFWNVKEKESRIK